MASYPRRLLSAQATCPRGTTYLPDRCGVVIPSYHGAVRLDVTTDDVSDAQVTVLLAVETFTGGLWSVPSVAQFRGGQERRKNFGSQLFPVRLAGPSVLAVPQFSRARVRVEVADGWQGTSVGVSVTLTSLEG